MAFMPPGLGPGFGGGIPANWTLLLLARSAVRANRLMAERWESLVETYPDQVEELAVVFGTVLRGRHPDVAAHHRRDRLEFAHQDGSSLLLEIGEPLRAPLGWGGVRLTARRPGGEVRLPARDLFLTFARGGQPEWVARLGGFPLHRAALVDAAVAEHLSDLVFGPANHSGTPPTPQIPTM